MADEEKSGPSKRAVVDSLVLACRYSRLRDIVGTDALRSVLDVEYRELVADGTFNLQLVWELFEAQPGFNPEHAAAPLCRFKSWERQLGIDVTMPAALRNTSETARTRMAQECDVPLTELQKALRSGVASESAGAGKKPVTDRSGRISQEVALAPDGHAEAEPSRRRMLIAAGIGSLGIIGFLVAGIFLYHECAPSASYQSISMDFARGLPVSHGERFGRQVRATLVDEKWLESPEEERRDALASAVRAAARLGIDVFYLQDRSGRVRAIAQLYDNGQQVRIVFK